MKNYILTFFTIIILFACKTELTKEQNTQLLKAYKEKNYFILDRLMSQVKFDRNNPDLLLYKATLDNVFNQSSESNKIINKLLNKYPHYFNDTIIANLYSMKAINSVRLQNYKEAFNDNEIIFSRYSGVYDSAELHSRRIDNDMFKNLFDIPEMVIEERIETDIPLKRDIAGLYNVPVVIKNDTSDFVFDTGANFSVITESLADKYGIKKTGNKFKVGGSTGKEVDAQAGICDISLGKLKIRNVLFTIFPDSTLSFAGGMYVIKGIIGFPVMLAFQEFTIKDDKNIIVPQKPEQTSERNFAIDGLIGVIMVKYKNDTLPFQFDTGASSTYAYSLFFNKYKSNIVNLCRKSKHHIAGAGGIIDSENYMIDSVLLTAGNSQCRLDSLLVFERDLMNDVKYVYGNFGQDYIKQFSEMKINFSSMNITFSNKK